MFIERVNIEGDLNILKIKNFGSAWAKCCCPLKMKKAGSGILVWPPHNQEFWLRSSQSIGSQKNFPSPSQSSTKFPSTSQSMGEGNKILQPKRESLGEGQTNFPSPSLGMEFGVLFFWCQNGSAEKGTGRDELLKIKRFFFALFKIFKIALNFKENFQSKFLKFFNLQRVPSNWKRFFSSFSKSSKIALNFKENFPSSAGPTQLKIFFKQDAQRLRRQKSSAYGALK